MNEIGKFHCCSHGWQEESFVCQHIFGSLHTGLSVGFHWPIDATESHRDAWCSECEVSRVAQGGEWTPALEAMLEIKLVCGRCYENAKDIWRRQSKEAI